MAETVLIIDDDEKVVTLIRRILELEGYEALEAYSGEEALGIMRKNPPDLVILDIMMPEMDGFQVLIELRADAAISDLPVVILSALTDNQIILKGWVRETDEYVTKPFEPLDLLDRIRKVLDRSTEERIAERARRLDYLLEVLQEVEEGNLTET